ncbi:MAG: biopolymer transporter ExbD [Deltaproteobacteria bacterium]|nr:biopolymer transporter ExbD [Deltaproteobacteria bacterium]
MAALDSGGGSSGKKAVNQEIPLIPFIDLLLCCVMFLLATAVWNQLAAINANQQVPGQASTEDAPPEDEKVKLILQVRNSGYVLGSSAGESIDISKRVVADQKELRDDLIVAPEDGVRYEDVVRAMDIATAAGFANLSMADGAAFL